MKDADTYRASENTFSAKSAVPWSNGSINKFA